MTLITVAFILGFVCGGIGTWLVLSRTPENPRQLSDGWLASNAYEAGKYHQPR